MDYSFQEKSLWLVLVSLTLVFAGYFYVALTTLPAGAVDVMPQQVVLFTLAVAAIAVVQIGGHVVIAWADRRADTDERDRLIELRGTRNGAYVLAIGVCVALCAALVTDGNFVFTHVLLAFWVAAQATETVSQLVMYRRGA